METFKYLFSGFWIFAGTVLLVHMTGNLIGYLWKTMLAFIVAFRHGYPPKGFSLDADTKPDIKTGSVPDAGK